MSMEAQNGTNPLTELGTGFRRDLVITIDKFDEKPSGQQILEAVDKLYDTDVTHGRLYPNLNELEERGMIDRGELDRRTNYYVLTDSGEEALESYREFVGE